MNSKPLLTCGLALGVVVAPFFSEHHFGHIDPAMAGKITATSTGTGSISAVYFVGMTSGFEYAPALPSTPLKADGVTVPTTVVSS